MINFDKEAKTYDQSHQKSERAKAFADEIIKIVPNSKKMSALDYGSGTGLVSFNLHENLKEIVLMDSSRGMTEESNRKIKTSKISSMQSVTHDLMSDEKYIKKFDLLYTLLVLHHIIDVKKILNKFYERLKDEGFLCIADLVAEDGSFHHKYPEFVGHNGFEIDKLIEILKTIGFKNFKQNIFYTIEKTVNGNLKKYPLFILIVQK